MTATQNESPSPLPGTKPDTGGVRDGETELPVAPPLDPSPILVLLEEFARGQPPRELLRTLLDASASLGGATSAALLLSPDQLAALYPEDRVDPHRVELGSRASLVCDGFQGSSPAAEAGPIVIPSVDGALLLHGPSVRELSAPLAATLQLLAHLAMGICRGAVTLDEANLRALMFEQTRKQLRERNDLLRDLSIVDDLTGLFNRRHFERSLAYEIGRFNRYRQPLGLAILDLDHFKSINDTHGHDAGDEVLRTVARAIQSIVRAPDIACRYGGEEFAILLPHTGIEGAARAAERLRRAVAELTVILSPDCAIGVTLSAGVASADSPATGAALVREADRALYQAKAGGRNRVVAAGTPDDSSSGAARHS